jgi:predicted TIM-barrel fold metal-dependent hydrolase
VAEEFVGTSGHGLVTNEGSSAASFPAGIDVHHHLLVPSYVSSALREGAMDAEWAAAHYVLTSQAPDSPARTFDCRCAQLREAGLGLAVISVPAVVFRTPELSIQAAHDSNTELLEAARSDPDHFRVMASLPVPMVDACLAELERLAADSLVSALILPAVTAEWSLDDEQLRPLWAAIADAGLPAMLHPSQEPWPKGLRKWRLGAGIGVPVETSLAALRLILSGLLDTFPTLDIIVPQLGGVLPYLTQRLIDRGRGDAKRDVDHYLRDRLYYDNNSYHPPALRCAVDTVGAHRIMLGSDYPFRGSLAQCVGDVTHADLDAGQREALLSGTARSLLPNLPPLQRSAHHGQ